MPQAVLGRGLAVLGRGIRNQPRVFSLAAAGSAVFALMTVASAYVVGHVVGQVVLPAVAGRRVAGGALAAGVAALFCVAALKVIGVFGRRLAGGAAQFQVFAHYRRLVTRRYLALPMSWHQHHPTGELLSNANADVEAAFTAMAPLPFAIGTVIMFIAAVISLLVVDWVLALVGLLLFPLLFVANVIYSRRMSPRIAHAQALRAQLSARAHESFDGALLVKTMGREEYEAARFAHHAGELRDALIRVGRVRGLFDPLIEALPSVGTLAALMVGAYRLQAGAVSVADVVSVAFLFTILGFPVRAIGWVLGDLPRAVIGYERIQRVLSARATMHYGTAELAGAGPASLRLAGVGFGYRPDQPVLHDVSFEVPAGQIVALVGPTGSGKSTIAALAARLIDPGQGTVSLDAIPVSELSAAALAGVVGLVGQVPFVFDDSVRGNVSLERAGVDDTVIWWALRCAQADHFVQALPDHLDADVGERGTTLSGGQRQRLTLARALAGRPRLLILDDATSAVDPTVEAAILARLREGITDPGPDGGGADGQGADGHRAAGGRIGLAATHVPSLLLIAHRRATIALADSVVFLERGRVIAQGTHTDLLARVPAYADLVTAYEREEDQVAA